MLSFFESSYLHAWLWISSKSCYPWRFWGIRSASETFCQYDAFSLSCLIISFPEIIGPWSAAISGRAADRFLCTPLYSSGFLPCSLSSLDYISIPADDRRGLSALCKVTNARAFLFFISLSFEFRLGYSVFTVVPNICISRLWENYMDLCFVVCNKSMPRTMFWHCIPFVFLVNCVDRLNGGDRKSVV